ncbi:MULTISPECIES: YidC/Oxa1 family membrane protein insertase [Streptococcus]|uniref:Membrane protein insertase YidC n=1 Tax=Streptococcus porcorum TaxID=701526 RepID=A0ABV2JDK4_9STRE|nr:YidC/Oxa1 family membrane protein insertase [Streptococcus sp.]
MKKKIKVVGMLLMGLLILTACGTGNITSSSSGGWEQFVYLFARAIRGLSFGNIGVGIILFTLVIRTVLLPVFNLQIKSSQRMQALQPELKALQAQYPGRDTDSRMALAEASQRLYKEHKVNPYLTLLPIFIQLPVLLALYQALTRVEFLKTGHFLWLDISQPDPYFILPVLAAGFTFLSTWLSSKSALEKNFAMTIMTYFMPVMIFFFSISVASGVALYWTVSNAYQVAQTLIFNNPFKIIAERQRLAQEEKEKEARLRKAKKKAQKKRK